MSTTGSEFNCNLAIEAMVRKIMSEMAIKSANDTVVSTEGTEKTVSLSTVSDYKMSSDAIASKNTEKQKKRRSRSSKPESKKMGKMKKSSSKDKKKNSKTMSKKNGSKISIIGKLLDESLTVHLPQICGVYGQFFPIDVHQSGALPTLIAW